eukprot:6214690-Pleurochrysis_carterae.AAC.1
MIGQSAYAGLRILQISLAGFQHKFVLPGFTESSDSFEHQRAYDERHYDPVRDVQETLPGTRQPRHRTLLSCFLIGSICMANASNLLRLKARDTPYLNYVGAETLQLLVPGELLSTAGPFESPASIPYVDFIHYFASSSEAETGH